MTPDPLRRPATPSPLPPADDRRAAALDRPHRTTRRGTRAVLALLGAVAVFAAWDGAMWWRETALQAQVAAAGQAASAPADVADLAPALRHAHARRLAEQGDLEAALKLFRGLHAETPLGRGARYNSATVLLQQAQVIRAGPMPGQAIPLIELAKELYREVLRADPAHWDARYNLERAQRMLPDPADNDDPPPAPAKGAERAATTMRGVSPGLP